MADLEQDVWTIGRLLDWTAQHLAKKGAEAPRLDAEVLLAHALGCKRIDLYASRHDQPASDELRARFRELVRRRLEGCPVAYLVGRKEFFSLEFEVGPGVLIPRPETEFVVMECLKRAKGKPRVRVVDIGTGSGAIAIAVARKLPDAEVTAIDLSEEALAIARRNASKHGVAERVRFLQGDLFRPIPAGEQFDFILSNPPYVATEDIPGLAVGVRDYEPHLALDGGPGGYAVLERLLDGAPAFLKLGGTLILEIGAAQEEAVRERFEARSGYTVAPTILDHARHPRVMCATWRS
jgi:release factor glutamine methyltransferase